MSNVGKLTVRAFYLMLQTFFQNTGAPSKFYAILIASGSTPDENTKTMAELTEIPTGNGYTSGGEEVIRGTNDWRYLTEDDVGNKATVEMYNVVFQTSGGAIPTSGSIGALVLTTGEATVSSRQILGYWLFDPTLTIPEGKELHIHDGVVSLEYT